MADFPLTAVVTPAGLNEQNRFVSRHVLGTALAGSDTLTITLPDTVPNDAVPHKVSVFTDATPALPNTQLAITSHNKTTGVSVLTAGGAVPVGSTVLVEYLAAG